MAKKGREPTNVNRLTNHLPSKIPISAVSKPKRILTTTKHNRKQNG